MANRCRVPLVVSLVLVVAACATAPFRPPLADRDQQALSYAIAHTLQAAPDARRYEIRVAIHTAPRSIADAVARMAERSVSDKERANRDVRSVVLNADLPEWRSLERGPKVVSFAAVRVSYSVDGALAVSCDVIVYPPGESLAQWAVRTDSDVPCWPRPTAASRP
jgi:hypothetical protein